MKVRHREQRSPGHGTVKEKEGAGGCAEGGIRPEGRAGRGCEMRWKG